MDMDANSVYRIPVNRAGETAGGRNEREWLVGSGTQRCARGGPCVRYGIVPSNFLNLTRRCMSQETILFFEEVFHGATETGSATQVDSVVTKTSTTAENVSADLRPEGD